MDIIHEINNIIKSDFSPAFKTGYFIGLLILLIVFIMAIKKITRKTINPKKSIKLSNNSKTPWYASIINEPSVIPGQDLFSKPLFWPL